MPVTLYSKTCYIKNDLYCLSIIHDDDNEQSSTNASFETNSTDSEFNVFPVDSIDPSLTRINLELIAGKKNTNIPKTIPLNHVLNVEQIQFAANKYQEYLDDTKPTITKQSPKSNKISMKKQLSEVILARTPILRRQMNFGRFFSTQSYTSSQVNYTLQTRICLSYVDMSNSIRWNVNKIMFDLDSEDMGNELYVNLDQLLLTLKQRPRSLLAFVNPFGGKGRDRKHTCITWRQLGQLSG